MQVLLAIFARKCFQEDLLFHTKIWMTRTRNQKRKQLQTKQQQADAAAATRYETSLNDGVYKKQRQKAEEHIASIICRSAEFDSSTQKFKVPRGKAKEVFELHSNKHFSGLNVGFGRVRDRVYSKLDTMKTSEKIVRERMIELRQNVEEEEVQAVSYFIISILLWNKGGFDKTLFLIA